ncbi:MAG: hypothetical protein CGU28_11400 [Candidatus Dactylopiibacterium carminicum]|uniref:DUF465 domain-containing protein n=1 Tax=Candidatus Dactylopiibacterium carminicum TaxID=857335 RepID=A0A272EQ52_9RHOO|nr:YdcH family protein [Candidatus Dactylopiibacterium carminicum]KAF7598523.1 DUF465 domain-containing protein [Candidatus Dactylopiibacterium carminicum]PAS92244.1 MAG: hypothetical protein CGU29_12325 [Candidatus Dactylopiibacterium carminicum]PAS95760.1 MAG: hypothetical protein CGU28_11400 [Candidatus Dactylopiibacterium carminicum]PAS98011.1 MAG: hypothetical protein BSR46_12910 [Candidatus Dactylopiibacterium carminicum]
MSDMFEEAINLRHRLDVLRAEHRELDNAISRLSCAPDEDELAMRRLKKRKLIVRDRITLIERVLRPESPA